LCKKILVFYYKISETLVNFWNQCLRIRIWDLGSGAFYTAGSGGFGMGKK
jgi:hypothetical protein